MATEYKVGFYDNPHTGLDYVPEPSRYAEVGPGHHVLVGEWAGYDAGPAVMAAGAAPVRN